MKRVGWEWRKLLTLPALWGFLALCLAFNGLLMANAPGDCQTFGEISATARALGQRVDQDFEEGLAQRPATSVQEALSQVTGEMTNVYAGYDLSVLVTRYQQLLSASPTASAWMTAKYQALEQRVDHLAQTGAAIDLYAGPMTHDSHQFLFGTLMRAMVGEGAVLGMLAALYLLGYEKVHRTEGMVYTTSTGRNMVRGKIVAAVTAGVALYLLLTGLTLGIYFVQWDYSGLWSASVSSQFNFLTDVMVRRPFLTWADFTVAQYLVACLALGGGLVVGMTLLAALCGTLVRSVYGAALVLLLGCLGSLALQALLAQGGLWVAFYLVGFLPVGLWLNSGAWFTEMGMNAILPWQECVSVGVMFLLVGLALWAACRRFRRKDLV